MMTLPSMQALSAGAALVLWCWWSKLPMRLTFWLKRLLFQKNTGPRLPPGGFGMPLLGHTLWILRESASDKLTAFLIRRKASLGSPPFFHASILPLYPRAIMVQSHDAVKWVLSREYRGFQADWPDSIQQLIGANGLSILQGKAHARLRSALLPLFQPKALEGYTEELNEIVADYLLRHWTPKAATTFEDGDNDTSTATREVNVKWSMKGLAFEVIGLLVLGLDLDKQRELVQELREQFDIWFGGLFLPTSIPGSPFFPALEARKRICELIDGIVNQRRKQRQQREDAGSASGRKDFLDMLLDPRKVDASSSSEDAEEIFLTNEEIADVVIVLLFAGSDTTASTLTWIFKFLEEHPMALDKLRLEHAALKTPKLSWDQMQGLKYTNPLIFEALRVEAPVPQVPRLATQDMVYKNEYMIPKGSLVVLNLKALMLDPANFESVDEFNSERFLGVGDGGPLSALSSSVSNFHPFGHGKRMCLGYRLAIAEINVILHHAVLKFDWKRTADATDDIIPFPIRLPKDGYPIVVSRRRNPGEKKE